MIRSILFTLFVAVTHFATAQCTPSSIYQDSPPGIWPHPSQDIPCAYADDPQGYNTVIDVKTMTDSSFTVGFLGSITTYIERFRVLSVSGLPEGVTFQPNESVWVNGGSAPNFTSTIGCVSVTASQEVLAALLAPPYQEGRDFNLIVQLDAFIASTNNDFVNGAIGGGIWLSADKIPDLLRQYIRPIELVGYTFKVRPDESYGCTPLIINSIANTTSSSFNVEGNFPNPFSKQTEIRYTAPKKGAVELNVFNLVGKKVLSKRIESQRGENTIQLSADQFLPGVYVYTLSDGAKTITRRMVVSGN